MRNAVKIITEQYRTTSEIKGGRPAGSVGWMAYGENPAFTGFGWTETEALSNLSERVAAAQPHNENTPAAEISPRTKFPRRPCFPPRSRSS